MSDRLKIFREDPVLQELNRIRALLVERGHCKRNLYEILPDRTLKFCIRGAALGEAFFLDQGVNGFRMNVATWLHTPRFREIEEVEILLSDILLEEYQDHPAIKAWHNRPADYNNDRRVVSVMFNNWPSVETADLVSLIDKAIALRISDITDNQPVLTPAVA